MGGVTGDEHATVRSAAPAISDERMEPVRRGAQHAAVGGGHLPRLQQCPGIWELARSQAELPAPMRAVRRDEGRRSVRVADLLDDRRQLLGDLRVDVEIDDEPLLVVSEVEEGRSDLAADGTRCAIAADDHVCGAKQIVQRWGRSTEAHVDMVEPIESGAQQRIELRLDEHVVLVPTQERRPLETFEREHSLARGVDELHPCRHRQQLRGVEPALRDHSRDLGVEVARAGLAERLWRALEDECAQTVETAQVGEHCACRAHADDGDIDVTHSGAVVSHCVVPQVSVSRVVSWPRAAPCQWRSFGGQTTSVPVASGTSPSASVPTLASPVTTRNCWPPGCECQYVTAPSWK